MVLQPASLRAVVDQSPSQLQLLLPGEAEMADPVSWKAKDDFLGPGLQPLLWSWRKTTKGTLPLCDRVPLTPRRAEEPWGQGRDQFCSCHVAPELLLAFLMAMNPSLRDKLQPMGVGSSSRGRALTG